ncbi:MAG: twin-arginine translocase TatA/TatE family subunit [Bacteroidaceae bacterium]|nr:twin-arginine translocase TatA/TatE family subunit [Bacteroidaceae bacterium]MBR1787925.1 twin-arginine translocase TatA/TatE family subunit [Bacteroidaceae bacterium]
MMNLLFLGGIGYQEILVVLLIVLLFYGGKKVPEMMRGLGQGVKAFKDGMNETAPTSGAAEKTTSDAAAAKTQEARNPLPSKEG